MAKNAVSAALAQGDGVNLQTFKRSSVHVGCTYNHITTEPSPQPVSPETPWTTEPDERFENKEKKRRSFLKKLNKHTSKNTKGGVTLKGQKFFAEPKKEFFPQMKTGFHLYHGDYVPQEGFSAKFQPKTGHYVAVHDVINTLGQLNEGKPYFIIGQPGSGKTILMKRFAKILMNNNNISTGASNVRHKIFSICSKINRSFEVVYHVNIRDIPNLQNATLAQVLFSPSVVHGLTQKEAEYGLYAILQKKITIIIFLDGLDQASWEPKADVLVGPWQASTTSRIFGNILSGHLLSEVPIVISSREFAVACLQNTMRPNNITALVGFSEKDAKELYFDFMTTPVADTQDYRDVNQEHSDDRQDRSDDDQGRNELTVIEQWDDMKAVNPRMMYMCLTPLFLIFYVLARKSDPKHPPDCATEVLTRIIEILPTSDNMRRQDTIDVINKLKPMAFHGTKKQTVLFTIRDLKEFGLVDNAITDLIIKAGGFNPTGQKYLQGMYKYFFSHQTLQEILSAMHVAEMKMKDFKELVDQEFKKSFWSVVRSFLCGILKNTKVRESISPDIFKPENVDEKCEYLMRNISEAFRSNPSPAEKLDIMIALKEADALDTLRESHLDFSETPMTPELIHLLISVMKHLDRLELLSLAGCGIDDRLLEVFTNRSVELQTKIMILNMSKNLRWSDISRWENLFKKFSIQTCHLDIPPEQVIKKKEYHTIVEIAKAARYGNVAEMNCRVSNLQINLQQMNYLISLRQLKIYIDELSIDGPISNYPDLSLQNFIEAHSIKACNILSRKRQVDIGTIGNVTRFIAAANIPILRFEYVKIREDDAERLLLFTSFGTRIEIEHLVIRPDSSDVFEKEVWQNVLEKLQINTCSIGQASINSCSVWADFCDVIKGGTVRNLRIGPNIKLELREVTKLLSSKPGEMIFGHIEKMEIITNGSFIPLGDWKLLGNVARKFDVQNILCHAYGYFPDISTFADGHKNLKIKTLLLAWRSSETAYFSIKDVTPATTGNVKTEREMEMSYAGSGQDSLETSSRKIGNAIRDMGITEVLIGQLMGSFPIKDFAAALGNTQIDLFAAMDLHSYDIELICRNCTIKKLILLMNKKIDLGRIRNLSRRHNIDVQYVTESGWKDLFNVELS